MEMVSELQKLKGTVKELSGPHLSCNAKAKIPQAKCDIRGDPTLLFVRQLTKRSDYRCSNPAFPLSPLSSLLPVQTPCISF